jgi:NitT/TauT family transport system permease protein
MALKPALQRFSEASGVLAAQCGLALVSILAWETAVRLRLLNPFYFGQPSQVAEYLVLKIRDGSLLSATWVTLTESLAGFVLGMSIGTALGLALWWSRTAAALSRPLLVALNAVPKLIFAPMFILVVGLGFEFKVLISFAGIVIVALLAAYVGAKQADADLIDLVRSMGGSRWQAFQLVVVPAALPWTIVSMEINIGLALIGAVVGEFLASDAGLGYLAVYAAGTFDMSLVLVAVTTLMVLAVGMYWAVRAFEWWALPMRPEFVENRH